VARDAPRFARRFPGESTGLPAAGARDAHRERAPRCVRRSVRRMNPRLRQRNVGLRRRVRCAGGVRCRSAAPPLRRNGALAHRTPPPPRSVREGGHHVFADANSFAGRMRRDAPRFARGFSGNSTGLHPRDAPGCATNRKRGGGRGRPSPPPARNAGTGRAAYDSAQNPSSAPPSADSRSFSKARLRIWRMRSRVTPSIEPISSSVRSSPSSRP
jgi:hypothetical protein